MSAVIAQCPNGDPKDICEKIRDEIRKLVFQTKEECGVRGLRERIMDQIYGKNGPGTSSWRGHDEAITNIKNQISKLMKDFGDNNCGDRSPIGKDAKAWINRPNPAPEDWKGSSGEPSVKRDILDWEYWEAVTGLSGAALALYLIVSEGSRLFPPRNLVPVP